MDIDRALAIEAAEREYLQSRVENLLGVDGNPFGARVFHNGGFPCFAVSASPSPMFNRVYGDYQHDAAAIVGLLSQSVTPLIGTPASLEQGVCLAGRQLERLKGWTHLQLACVVEHAVIDQHAFAIEEVNAETLPAFLDIHAAGFHTKAEQRLLNRASFSYPASNQRARIYVLKSAGEVVAGAVLYLASNGVAYLGTAATQKNARGLGYHGALINHRIEQAKLHGSRLIAATALANSQSRRNLQRAGLTVSHAQALYRLAED